MARSSSAGSCRLTGDGCSEWLVGIELRRRPSGTKLFAPDLLPRGRTDHSARRAAPASTPKTARACSGVQCRGMTDAAVDVAALRDGGALIEPPCALARLMPWPPARPSAALGARQPPSRGTTHRRYAPPRRGASAGRNQQTRRPRWNTAAHSAKARLVVTTVLLLLVTG